MAGSIYRINFRYVNTKMSPENLDGLGARDIFPCLDQIHMKAQFKINLQHDNTVQGLSNSVLASTEQLQG